jgi:hypothetical protein
MEQFIGCDAHKKFSVFVAVNEKGHAGEALRVAHDRGVVPRVSGAATTALGESRWGPAGTTVGWWMSSAPAWDCVRLPDRHDVFEHVNRRRV